MQYSSPDFSPKTEAASLVEMPQPLDPEQPKLHPDTYAVAEELANLEYARAARYVRSKGFSYGMNGPEDIVQEALLGFMESYHNTPPPTGEGEVYRRIFQGIVKHKVVDTFRQHYRGGYRLMPVSDMATYAEPATRQEEHTILDEVISKAAKGMTSGQKELLRLLAFNPESSGQEMSTALGTTCGAYRVMKHRTMRAFVKRVMSMSQSDEVPAHLLRICRQVLDPDPFPQFPKPVKTTISKMQHTIRESIDQRHAQGERHLVVDIPDYLAPWRIVSKGIRSYLNAEGKHSANPGPALIAYPHAQLLPAFSTYVSEMTSRRVVRMTHEPGPAIVVDTPAAIMGHVGGKRFDYVAWGGELTPALQARLGRDASRLVQVGNPTQSMHFLEPYEAPPYGPHAQRILWESEDSVRYLQEFRFRTGEPLTEEMARQLANEGVGPPIRRLCRGIGSFAALRAIVEQRSSFRKEHNAENPTCYN